MNKTLYYFKIFYFVLLLLVFSGNGNAQCTVTGNVNTSTIPCSSYTGCTAINIGNGSTATSLNFNADLDLTCLGAIKFIVKNNASVDFGSSDRLYLGAGSSIIVEAGGDLSGASCNASERIYIGGVLYASCNGQGGATATFSDIETFGGSGSVTTNSPVCNGNTFNFSATPPPNGSPFTYTWYDGSNNQIGTGQNVSITATSSGTYQVQMFSASLNKTMIINFSVVVNSGASTAAPTVSITQPTCTLATGTIAITAPTGVGTTYSINGLTYTNTSGVFTSLASGTYSVTARNSSGCISNATSVVVKNATNTWSGSAWSNGAAPISTENIVFNGSYSTTADLVGCSCQVNNSVAVVVKSGHTLTLTNGLTVAPSASMTFENSASLVQINNVSNSGNINYKRYASIRNTDYTYWSSPVFGYTLGGVSQNKTLSDKYYSFDSTLEDWKQESAATVMTAGVGYIVRGPEPTTQPPLPPPPSLYEASFVGVPNNGDYSIPAIADNSYLLGNPYPSAIEADKFFVANASVLNGTLYFWTHKTAIGVGVSNPGSGVYAYSSDDYATYNLTGGVGAFLPDIDPVTGLPITTGAAPSGGAKPNGFISAGQGFFASTQVTPSGNPIVFNNSMRIAGGTILTDGNKVNEQFFKTRNPKEKGANPIEKNRVWLNLTNTQGAFKQTLVGYLTDATNEYDSRFDGESFDGHEFVDFYSINADKNLTIQGRALPFDENDEVPLGFRTTINGTFTINIDQVDGLLANQKIFIEDKLTNTVTDLKNGNYTFSTTAGTFDERFVLRYTDKTINKTLSVDEMDTNDGIIVLYSNNYKTLIIRNNVQDATVDSVTLFNMLGQKINSWEVKDKEQTGIQIPIKNISSEIYIVKVKTTKGETSKKIVIR